MKILWLSDFAHFKGGAEGYIFDMVNALTKHDHYQLYKFDETVSGQYCEPFCGVFPLVDIEQQIKAIAPDVIYIHNIQDENLHKISNDSGIPTFRFIHDHKLFCPREHKYTLMKSSTCTRKYGLSCLFCCGLFNKQQKEFVTPWSLDSKNREVMRGHKVLVSSEYMRSQLLSYGYPLEKIKKLSLYSRFEKTNEKAKKTNDVLYIGALLKGKGIPLLLRALEQSTIPLCVTLVTNDILGRKIFIKNEMVTIKVIHKVDREILSGFITKSRVVVVPSLSPETFSFAGVEALSLGTPVIASNVGGIQEWSNKAGVDLFTSGNTKELIGKIEKHVLFNGEFVVEPISYTKENHAYALESLLEEAL